MASEVSSMTLAPDRTCRLKFPVVAEELIEYSGARHGERSRREPRRENFGFRKENFRRPAAVAAVVGKCLPREWRKDVATDGEFFSALLGEKISSLFHSLIIARPRD